jgi:hypothetical protein
MLLGRNEVSFWEMTMSVSHDLVVSCSAMCTSNVLIRALFVSMASPWFNSISNRFRDTVVCTNLSNHPLYLVHGPQLAGVEAVWYDFCVKVLRGGVDLLDPHAVAGAGNSGSKNGELSRFQLLLVVEQQAADNDELGVLAGHNDCARGIGMPQDAEMPLNALPDVGGAA